MLGRVVDPDARVVHVGVDALLGPEGLDEVGLEGEPLGLRQEAQVELAVLDLTLGVVPHRRELNRGGMRWVFGPLIYRMLPCIYSVNSSLTTLYRETHLLAKPGLT